MTPARLFLLFARNAPIAVIFRRGPSKWVQLVKWDTANDTFEPGQWFHGRVLRENVSGEDDPIYSDRLTRDGWALVTEWEVENRGYPKMYHTKEAEMREKRDPSGTFAIHLKRSISGLDYAEEFTLVGLRRRLSLPIASASWMDWDQSGRLVFARGGKIFAATIDGDSLSEKELFDFNESKPNPMSSPEWAKTWGT